MSERVVVAAEGDSSAMVDVASPLLEFEVLAAASRKESPPPPSSTSPLVVAVADAAAFVDMAVAMDSQIVLAIRRFQFPISLTSCRFCFLRERSTFVFLLKQ